MVVGVVSARYNSADGWLRDSVWVARVEDLVPLLAGLANVDVAGRPAWGEAVDVVLAVSETAVRLVGGGVEVSAGHGGVGPGLVAAVGDVRRARSRLGGLRAAPVADAAAVGVSLRRVGVLLAQALVPAAVAAGLVRVLDRAESEHVPVRLGVVAGGVGWLPWEALSDPRSGRPLALDPLVTVYRKLPAPAVRAVAGPLRIVVAISAPDSGSDAGVLDYERELRNVLAAVRGARGGEARVREVRFASTAAIRAALVEEPAHVLHLSGHGSPGVLTLEDARGVARPVDADTFVEEAIPAGAMPAVISLAACYTDVPAEAGGCPYVVVKRLGEQRPVLGRGSCCGAWRRGRRSGVGPGRSGRRCVSCPRLVCGRSRPG